MEKSLKKYGTAQLQNALKKATGEKLEIIKKILTQRGVTVEAETTQEVAQKELPEVIVKASKTAAKVVKEIKTKKEKVAKEAKPQRLIFAGHSKEAIAEAKANVGKECQFVPHRGTEAIDGKISCLIFDGRVNRMFYRIKAGNPKKTYHVLISNSQILID